MTTRVFALIIGIDNYKSGGIWNLHSCVDDARRIRSWLVNDLNVPEDQICTLLDKKATKNNIEDHFMSHLTNNRSIEKGDAILIYFAGHGSLIPAPEGWFQPGKTGKKNRNVEVLCTYDYEIKATHGRIAGISDKSMRAMLSELSQAKGDNITLILDTCFSPGRDIEHRGDTRSTPTTKATSDDLYRCLWSGARGRPYEAPHGFLTQQNSHVCLAACGNGGQAIEGKNGGRLTHCLLELVSELSLHRLSYNCLLDRLQQGMPENQQPVCHGLRKERILFDAIPFSTDAQFLFATLENDDRFRIEAGLIHGLIEGSELSLHLHNHRCSKNPSFSTVVVEDLHPTWCFARPQNTKTSLPRICWARITQWNNRRPFRVNLKATFTSFIRMWKFSRTFNAKGGSTSRSGLNIMRVRKAAQADISLNLGRHAVTVERHDDIIATNNHRIVKIEKRTGEEVLADAARFHLHLYRRNPENPFKNLISMELYRLHPEHWTTMGGNLLHKGKAIIPYEQGAIFSISLYNKSDIDLWPYLAYMDPNCYGITMLYQPDHTSSSPPLPKKGHLEIGSGKPGSEALSFALPDHEHLDSGYLKLFLSPTPIAMGMIEQGPSLAWTSSRDIDSPPASPVGPEKGDNVWDTSLASVVFLRHDG